MKTCKHEKFEANVAVGRIMEDEQSSAEDAPIGFVADITIKCADCNVPFHFIGVEHGLSPKEPRISVGGLELHAPIAPGELKEIPSRINYATFGSEIIRSETEN